MLAAMPGIGTCPGIGQLCHPWGTAAGKQSAGGVDVVGKGIRLSQPLWPGGPGAGLPRHPHIAQDDLFSFASLRICRCKAQLSVPQFPWQAGLCLPLHPPASPPGASPPSFPAHAWGLIPGGEGGSWQPCCSQHGSLGFPAACCGWPCRGCPCTCVGTRAAVDVCGHTGLCTYGCAQTCLCAFGLHAHTRVGVHVCVLAHTDVQPSCLLLPPVTPVRHWQKADPLQAHDYFLGGSGPAGTMQ